MGGFILATLLFLCLMAWMNHKPTPRYYDDNCCRCGSHTHPGFICRICGKEA